MKLNWLNALQLRYCSCPGDAVLRRSRIRRRFVAGEFTVVVEIGDDVTEMLIATRWLKGGESDDRKKIARAIAAMLAEAAKR